MMHKFIVVQIQDWFFFIYSYAVADEFYYCKEMGHIITFRPFRLRIPCKTINLASILLNSQQKQWQCCEPRIIGCLFIKDDAKLLQRLYFVLCGQVVKKVPKWFDM